MKLMRGLEKRVRGWLPKGNSLPVHQGFRATDHLMRLLVLRLVYGVTLGAMLVTPFGVYHSRSEPYISGLLWGYNLPVGYAGLLLGALVILYPNLKPLRKIGFSSLISLIGFSLLISVFFSSSDYFVNLMHGTNFSSIQIDVDFAVGNSAALGLSLLSIIFGLTFRTRKQKEEGTNLKRRLNRFRGWIPKEPIAAYANKPLKPRWKKPAWIAFTLVAVLALAFFAYRGVQTLVYYSNPQADVTASYFDKSLNCTTANVGDIVEVKTRVYWHGHVLPEFQRQVNIIDSYPQSNFELVSGNNTLQYNGSGGGDQFTYMLKVISTDFPSVELPKPTLYLDNSEIPLTGTSAVLEIQSVSEPES